jgi:uncharacterized protein HemY
VDLQGLGRTLITIGALVALFGALLVLGHRFHFGHLPGDLVLHRGNATIYIPITTMVVASVVLTVVVNLIFRIFHR